MSVRSGILKLLLTINFDLSIVEIDRITARCGRELHLRDMLKKTSKMALLWA